ncbi:MAG: Sua5/YciO/YrdC/YwlC family protein [Oceanospirillaceae bacterium]|nr:Sua5/YciO/YrdC/YwlC family protein [Oceanospirillaceae bacterium]
MSSVDIAVDALQRCGVVAYPTEAVWGLGCDPFDYSAVQKILALKNRPEHKGLILVAADITQITQLLAPLSKSQINKLISSWPGPTTWVIEDINNIYPSWIKGQHSSVAIRVSSHSTIKALCNAFGGVLVSTSLNPSGMPSAVSESQSRAYFGDEVSYFVEGDVDKNSQPSKIIILNSGKLLR